jgi:hypothetical protein
MSPYDAIAQRGQQLQDELGLPLLAYVLNRTEKQVATRLSGGRRLGQAQEAALSEIVAALTHLEQTHLGGASEGMARPSVLATLLIEYSDHRQMSAANALRTDCGGELPSMRSTTDLVASLETLARDAYPATLLPRADQMPIPGLLLYGSMAVHRHPARHAFEAAVLQDEELARLFPHQTDQSGHTGSYYTNLGHGGSIQLWMLAEGLITAAHSALSLDEAVTQTNLVRGAVANLDRLRRLVQGRGVQVKARLGLAGVDLGTGGRVQTPWGALRKPTDAERERIGDLGAVVGDVVFEVPVTMKLYLGSGTGEQHGQTSNSLTEVTERLHADLNERAAKLALSVLLAVERERAIAPVRSWTMFDSIFHPGAGLSWTRLAFALSSECLQSNDRRDIRIWGDRVRKHYHPSITVAVQRVLSAVSHRLDPTDGLIDAVIALENLFGTSSAQGELTFRVSTASAWLLESTTARRRQRRHRVSAIYRERSKIVHGNAPGSDVAQYRDDAVSVVRESLKALFRDRPDLLPNRDRSIDLIIDGQVRAP